MVLIEGVGDEVIATLGVGLAVLLVLLAWWSTRVPELRWPRVIQWQVVIAREVSPRSALVEQFTVTASEDRQNVTTPVVVESSQAASAVRPASSAPPTLAQDVEPSNVASQDGGAASAVAAAAVQTSGASDQSRPGADAADVAAPSAEDPTEGTTEALQSAEQHELRRRRCNFLDAQISSPAAADGGSAAAVHAPNLPSSDGESPARCNDSRSATPTSDLGEGSDIAGSDGSKIRIRLRYLTETERLVLACPSTTVMSFKRQNFAEDLAANKLVRFIFNGQVLQDDRTLESYNIIDNTVVHTLISLADSGGSQQGGATGRQSATAAADSHEVFDAGSLMVPLFALILAVIWYLRFAYRQFFNITSTLSLVGITLLFGICLYANNRRQRQLHQPAAAST